MDNINVIKDRYNLTVERGGKRTIDPNDFLPPNGNYKDVCKEIRIVSTDPPNVDEPVFCIMECLVPKKMGNVVVRYYKNQIKFRYNKDKMINTLFDGKLIIGDPDSFRPLVKPPPS